MARSPGELLDQANILKRVYDKENEALKVKTTAINIVGGAAEVLIDHTNDSIKIGDGTDFLSVNPDGSINVNVIDGTAITATPINVFDEVLNVVNGVTVEIVNYTVPVGKTASLKKIACSGENIATYMVYIDTNIIDKKRTYFGNSLNIDFDFNNGLLLTAGQTVSVEVFHLRPDNADFNARIQIEET